MRTPSILSAPVTHRIGNWCEETVLRDEQIKNFLEKQTTGSLSIQRSEQKRLVSLQAVPLPKRLQFGQNMMIQNYGTGGFLSIDIPDAFPDDVTVKDRYFLTTAEGHALKPGGDIIPTARSVFKIVPCEDYLEIGLHTEIPRYGMRCYITTCDELLEKPMYLSSVPKNLVHASRRLNNQIAYLSFDKCTAAEWSIVYPDPLLSLEMEGQPVQLNELAVLEHKNTKHVLGSEKSTKSIIRNDFGVEWDVDLSRSREAKWDRWIFRLSA